MAVNSKAIKQRIKSVKNTKKITKAMEMVSAAKMRKAVGAALNTRLYATLARELLENLARRSEVESPLLATRPVNKLLVILVSSNRGLCGSFNANLFKKTFALLRDKANVSRHRVAGVKDIAPSTTIDVDLIGIGKKSAWFAKKSGHKLVAAFDGLNERPAYTDVLPISQMAMSGFTDGTYDKVVVVYTNYKSSLVQEVKMRQLLPISGPDLEKMLADLPVEPAKLDVDPEQYMFEPDLETVAKTVLPRLVEIQVYQAVLESAASEYSARMVAMKNASSAAGDMINGLTLQFNKARQAAITQEIAEIAGGAAALE